MTPKKKEQMPLIEEQLPDDVVSLYLKRIHLKNFKQFTEYDVAIEGKTVHIYGDNETGKTTLLDAFLWCLTGKDSQGREDYDIKRRENGAVVHKAPAEVELSFTKADGSILVLKRVYRETWDKHGEKLTGHKTHFYVGDNEEVQDMIDKDYQAYILKLTKGLDVRLFVDATFFNDPKRLHWERRRQIITDMIGDEGQQLADLTARKKAIKLHKSELDRNFTKDDDGFPTTMQAIQIKEQQSMLPHLPEDSTEGPETLKKRQAELLQQKANGSRAQTKAKLELQIAERKAVLVTIETQQTDKIRLSMDKIRTDKTEITNNIQQVEDQLSTKRREQANILAEMQELMTAHNDLDFKYKSFFNSTFDTTCQWTKKHCDEISKAGEATFNSTKAKRLEELRAEDNEKKAKYQELKAMSDKLNTEINELSKQIPDLEAKRAGFDRELDQCDKQIKDVKTLPEYTDPAKEVEALESNLSTLSEAKDQDTTKIDEELKVIEGKLEAFAGAQGIKDQRERILDRIKDLEEKEKAIAKESDEVNNELLQVNTEIRDLITSVDSKVDGLFKYASYKMFKPILKGQDDLEEICEVTDKKGVQAISDSQGMKAGLDAVKVVSEHYGVYLPCFRDRAESIKEIPDMGNIQVITLTYSPEYQRLTNKT